METLCPVRVEACKDVEGETVEAGLGWDILDCFDQIWEGCREGCSFSFWIGDEVERPSGFGSVGRSLVFVNEMTKMGAVEGEGIDDVLLVSGGKAGRVWVIGREITLCEGCVGVISSDFNMVGTDCIMFEVNEVMRTAEISSHLCLLSDGGGF